MFGSSDDSYDKDRVTNMSAVTVQLGVSAKTIDTPGSYEQTYNTECNYDCVGNSVAAEEASPATRRPSGSTGRSRWGSSRSSCATLRDAAPGQGEGGAHHLQPVAEERERAKLHRAHHRRQQKSDRCNKDQNIFDSKKWVKAATVEGLETKLNSSQQRTWWGT